MSCIGWSNHSHIYEVTVFIREFFFPCGLLSKAQTQDFRDSFPPDSFQTVERLNDTKFHLQTEDVPDLENDLRYWGYRNNFIHLEESFSKLTEHWNHWGTFYKELEPKPMLREPIQLVWGEVQRLLFSSFPGVSNMQPWLQTSSWNII